MNNRYNSSFDKTIINYDFFQYASKNKKNEKILTL